MTEKVLWGHKRGTEEWAEDIISTQPARFEAAKIWAAERGYDRFRVSIMDLSRPPDFAGTVRRNPAYSPNFNAPVPGIKVMEPAQKSTDSHGVIFYGRAQLSRPIIIGRRFHWLAFRNPGSDSIQRMTIQSGGGYIELNGAHGTGWWLSTEKKTRRVLPPSRIVDFIGRQIRDVEFPRHNPRYDVKGVYQARGVQGKYFATGSFPIDAHNKKMAERKARATGHYHYGARFRPFRILSEDEIKQHYR